ncbi:meiotic recombination protein REC114 isoform 1-T1 [Pangshura tecta]
MAAADEGGCVWLGRKVSVSTSEPADTVPCFLPEQARDAGTVSPLSSAETWPLKRYGRFVSPGDPPCGAGASVSWKVLESDEESGHLILTIVVSGHFFISQRRAVQEGFSLIDAQKWLKIVRRADCLLFGSKLKPSHIIAKPPAQSCRSFPERQRSVTELAQSVLKSSTFALPLAYQHSVWSAEELGPFIHLCLMDQNFPAFVEEVEKELKKLTEG